MSISSHEFGELLTKLMEEIDAYATLCSQQNVYEAGANSLTEAAYFVLEKNITAALQKAGGHNAAG
jgi:hypothetical protein